ERWRQARGRPWEEQDVEALFHAFIPFQMEVLDRHSQVVPGLLETVEALRRRNLRIAGTTGYFREAAERVAAAAPAQGYVPDHNVGAEEVPAGRPAPWMIFRNMEALDVYPPLTVLKVGDTVPDIQEGLNAGVWSTGVTATSSAVGCTEAEFEFLPPE